MEGLPVSNERFNYFLPESSYEQEEQGLIKMAGDRGVPLSLEQAHIIRKEGDQAFLRLRETFSGDRVDCSDLHAAVTWSGGGGKGKNSIAMGAFLEQKLGGKLAENSHVKMMAGTSVGSFFALGLTRADEDGKPKFSCEEFLETFDEFGPDIFPNGPLTKLKRLLTGRAFGILRPKYSKEPLYAYLKPLVGADKLQDSPIGVMINAVPLEDEKPLEEFSFFPGYPEESSNPECLVWQVAGSSASAPSYFSPEKVKMADGTEKKYSDGGLTDNDLSDNAAAKMQRMFPGKKILIISMGTGEHKIFSQDSTVKKVVSFFANHLGWTGGALYMLGFKGLIDKLMKNDEISSDLLHDQAQWNDNLTVLKLQPPFFTAKQADMANTTPEILKEREVISLLYMAAVNKGGRLDEAVIKPMAAAQETLAATA
ncbi:MAG: patatin-like phospholipase family protein [Chlamydiota bacterium]